MTIRANAAAESFFATLKTELLHQAVWPTRQHAGTAIFNYVEGLYNRLRRLSTLDYLSSDAFEALYVAATLAAKANRPSERVKTSVGRC